MSWRHGIPACEANERVEVWTHLGPNSWFAMIGRTSLYNGEVIIKIEDMLSGEWHQEPPVYTESDQVWRTLQ